MSFAGVQSCLRTGLQMLKVKVLALSLFFVGIGFAGSEARAQDDPLRIDATGRCPGLDVLGKLRGVRKAEKGRGYSFVVNPAAQLFTGPNRGDRPLRLRLNQTIPVFGRIRLFQASSGRILVSNTDRSLCGWMSREDILGLGRTDSGKRGDCGGNRLYKKLEKRRGQIRGAPYLSEGCAPMKGYFKAGSTLRLRAVIHNLSTRGNNQINLYKVPGSNELAGTWKHFEIFDVFATRKVSRAKAAAKGGKHGRYFLVGSTTEKGQIINGWVREDDVYISSTRMAAFWEGTGGAQGLADDGSVIISEPKQLSPIGGQILPRFPVIGSDPDADQLNKRIAEGDIDRAQVLKSVRSFNVVLPGKYCKIDSPNECIDSSQYDQIIGEVHRAIERYRNIDIVFLIDGSESMEQYFRPVTNAVIKLAKHYDTSEDRDVRVAVVLYEDYLSTDISLGNVDYRPVVPLHDPGASRDIDRLTEYKLKFADKFNDLLEAPFAAIMRLSRDRRRWRQDSGLKFIIHIADHGNRKLGERDVVIQTSEGDKRLAGGLGERFNISHVINELRQRGISYVPLAVRGEKFYREANERFVKQASAIATALTKSEELARPLTKVYSISGGDVEREIVQALEDTINVQSKYFETVAAIPICKVQGLPKPKCLQLMKQKGGRTKGWAGIFSHEDIIRKAFGSKAKNILDTARQQTVLEVRTKPFKGGKSLLNYWMMVHQKDWNNFYRIFKIVCSSFHRDRFRQKAFLDVLDAIAAIATTHNKCETLNDCLKKATYIFPGLTVDVAELKETFDDFEEADRIAVRRKFCRTRDLLAMINNGETVGGRGQDQSRPFDLRLIKWNNVDEIWQMDRKSISEFDWWRKFDNRMLFYYVPLEFLP